MKQESLNFLCICTYFKGADFLRTCKKEGNRVFLLTKKKLENADWPWESIDDVFYVDGDWVEEHVRNGIAYKFREIRFDRFVALDDFDVEKVARLREHFRMPGMGDTTGRHFRDKLAMRVQGRDKGINVPAFVALFNNQEINEFADNQSPPWLLKPRMEASAAGIQKIYSKEHLWEVIDKLGDERHHFLIESFAPGDVYHVDSLTFGNEVVFSRASKYLDTPFDVAHSGGIFRSQIMKIGSKEEKALQKINAEVLKSFGLQHGASHTEFIKSKDTGELFFLETSCRVGGANIAEMIEMGTRINLWSEWARIETAVLKNEPYHVPQEKDEYAGIVVSLSRFENPDDSEFDDPAIRWRMRKPWHIGFIVVADSEAEVTVILETYTKRIAEKYHASAPAPDKLE